MCFVSCLWKVELKIQGSIFHQCLGELENFNHHTIFAWVLIIIAMVALFVLFFFRFSCGCIWMYFYKSIYNLSCMAKFRPFKINKLRMGQKSNLSLLTWSAKYFIAITLIIRYCKVVEEHTVINIRYLYLDSDWLCYWDIQFCFKLTYE